MAPEAFDSGHGRKGKKATPANDVYMLGSCFVELATACERQPFDWLGGDALTVFRVHDSTRHVNCIEVRPYAYLSLHV